MKYNNFSLYRFGRLTRWNIFANWKKWFKFFMTITIMFCLFFCIRTYNARFFEQEAGLTPPEFDGIEGFIVAVTFVLWTLVAPSSMFNTLRTKQQRIEYLTLPATNLERYTSLFVVTNLAILATTVGGTVLADIVRLVFKAAIGDFNTSLLTVDIIRNLFSGDFSICDIEGCDDLLFVNMMVACVCLGLLYVYTCYLLGSALFRKANFILTSIVLLVIMPIMLHLIPLELDSLVEYQDRYVITSIAMAVLFLLSVFNVWASYKIFTRMQVVNNKWVNL